MRRQPLELAYRLENFNPRTHVGCDLRRILACYHTYISIHAPTWGATVWVNSRLSSHPFQSTHPRGVRHPRYIVEHLHNEFQSTHPRGVRPKSLKNKVMRINFNPRTHVGCDLSDLCFLLTRERFQSTHPRGVRHQTLKLIFSIKSFQSTHPRGVRLLSHQMVGF